MPKPEENRVTVAKTNCKKYFLCFFGQPLAIYQRSIVERVYEHPLSDEADRDLEEERERVRQEQLLHQTTPMHRAPQSTP
jgi:hypothetical protein